MLIFITGSCFYCTDISYCMRYYNTDIFSELAVTVLISLTEVAATVLVFLTEGANTALIFLIEVAVTVLIFLTKGADLSYCTGIFF